MKKFRIQNTCILIGIILMDIVVYLLLVLLQMGGGQSVLTHETMMTFAMILWHGVNLLLMGYLIYMSVKAYKKGRAPQFIKHNNHDNFIDRAKGKRKNYDRSTL